MTIIEKAKALREKMDDIIAQADDALVLSCAEAVDRWTEGAKYKKGYVVQDNGILYRCLKTNKAKDTRPADDDKNWAVIGKIV